MIHTLVVENTVQQMSMLCKIGCQVIYTYIITYVYIYTYTEIDDFDWQMGWISNRNASCRPLPNFTMNLWEDGHSSGWSRCWTPCEMTWYEKSEILTHFRISRVWVHRFWFGRSNIRYREVQCDPDKGSARLNMCWRKGIHYQRLHPHQSCWRYLSIPFGLASSVVSCDQFYHA
jgi:hypothetical protein